MSAEVIETVAETQEPEKLATTPPEAPVELKEQVRGDYRSIIAAMSDEEQAAAAEKARKLIHKDKFLQLGLTVLRETRRLYSMGLAAVNRHMDEIGRKPEDGVEAILVSSATQEAMKEFSREEVAETMQNIIMPFVASECSLEKQREQNQVTKQAAVEDRFRRTTGVPVPGPTEFNLGTLARGTVSVLIGNPGALQAYRDNLIEFIDTLLEQQHSNVTVHLKPELTNNSINKRKDAKYLPIGANGWTHCAQNISTAHKMLDRWLEQTKGNVVDLLLIDNLDQTYKGLLEGMPPARLAGHAQKTLRKYADDQGAAVLAFLDCEVPDDLGLTGDWEELLRFSDVYIVEKDAAGKLSTRSWHGDTPSIDTHQYLKG